MIEKISARILPALYLRSVLLFPIELPGATLDAAQNRKVSFALARIAQKIILLSLAQFQYDLYDFSYPRTSEAD